MAITAQQPAWQRWPQQPHNPEYMVVPTTMMPYDTQTVTSGPLQRPMMASDFFPSMSSYRTAPMTNMGGPQYSPHVPFNSYHFGSPSPVAPFKQPNLERPMPRIMPIGSHQSRESSYSHESQSCNMDGSRSPSVKSESTALSSVKSEMSMDGSPKADKKQRTGRSSISAASRTIDPIIALNEAAEAQFNTPIDTLMRDIQAKRKQVGPKDEATHTAERLETLKVTKKASSSPCARETAEIGATHEILTIYQGGWQPPGRRTEVPQAIQMHYPRLQQNLQAEDSSLHPHSVAHRGEAICK